MRDLQVIDLVRDIKMAIKKTNTIMEGQDPDFEAPKARNPLFDQFEMTPSIINDLKENRNGRS